MCRRNPIGWRTAEREVRAYRVPKVELRGKTVRGQRSWLLQGARAQRRLFRSDQPCDGPSLLAIVQQDV